MTFTYKKKTRQIQVVSSESEANLLLCDQSELGATHVVTEVKTGFSAVLNFESEINDYENMTKKEVAKSLDALVHRLPSEGIEGSVLTGEKKADAVRTKKIKNNMKFVFYGDTVIDPPPSSYKDAIQVYKSLPAKSLIEERVVSFSVSPLEDYCNERSDIVIEIANKNVADITQMFMDFKAVEKFFRELKITRVATDFQRYREVLIDLEQRYQTYRSKVSSRIKQVLPKIRSNASSEQELVDIVIEYKNSKYEKEEFLGLLYTRKKEVETIEYIVYNPEKPSSVLIDMDHSGDMSKCIIEHDYTLVYELEVLPKDITHVGEQYLNDELNEENRWFMKKDEIGLNRPLLGTFLRLAKKNQGGEASICFLISLTRDSNEEKEPFRLQLLKNGKLLINNYYDPEPVWNIETIDVGHDNVHLRIHHEPIEAIEIDGVFNRIKIIYNEHDTEVCNSHLEYL